jgi:acyl-CoA thioester hydrolase
MRQRAASSSVRAVETRTRVRYAETDQMAIAHHANYIVWFELGRTDLCRATGITYRSIEERGYIMVVAEVRCRYRIPFRYDDEVLIRTSVAEAASRSMTFRYDLLDGEGARIHATGESVHLWLNAQSRKPVVADRDVMAAFEPWVDKKSEG